MTQEEVADILRSREGYRVCTDSTMLAYSKKELVSFIRVLEHNWAATRWSLDQQAENVKDWEPVVHAHWVTIPRTFYYNEDGTATVRNEKKQCSLCHQTNKNYTPPYCPHCGARMDEEVRDDKAN